MMREYFLPLLGAFGFLEYLKHDPDVPDSDVTPEYCARHNWLVGSPATVAEKLERVYEEVGGFGTLLRVLLRLLGRPGRGLAHVDGAPRQGGAAAGQAPRPQEARPERCSADPAARGTAPSGRPPRRPPYGFRITRVAAVPVPLPCHSANSNALLTSASGKLCETTFDSGYLSLRAHEEVERGGHDPRVVVHQRRAT